MLKTKVSLNGDLRRVTVPVIDFEALTKKIREIYLLDEAQQFRVRFQDPDGDLVTISNDAGLADALTCCADTELLRLFVELIETPSSSTSSSSSSSFSQLDEEELHSHHLLSPDLCAGLMMEQEQQQLAEAAALVEAVEDMNRQVELSKLVAIHRRISARRNTVTTESRRMAAKSRRLCQRASAVERKITTLVRRSPHLAEQVAEAGIALPLPGRLGRSHAFCDGCNCAILLTEIRYKCTMCFDFDLCQRCEAASVHDPSHPLIKMQPEAQQSAPATPCCELELWWQAACQEIFTLFRSTSLSHIVFIAFISFVLSFFSAYALASLITSP